jgi:hypothetical protein
MRTRFLIGREATRKQARRRISSATLAGANGQVVVGPYRRSSEGAMAAVEGAGVWFNNPLRGCSVCCFSRAAAAAAAATFASSAAFFFHPRSSSARRRIWEWLVRPHSGEPVSQGRSRSRSATGCVPSANPRSSRVNAARTHRQCYAYQSRARSAPPGRAGDQ